MDGKIQVLFWEETEFGRFQDALYYTDEQWPAVTEDQIRQETRKRIDSWLAHLNASGMSPIPVEIVPAKVLMLFGAGASYGARGISPQAPPLGPGLFEELQKAFPDTWGKVSNAIARIFKDNPEKGMEALGMDLFRLAPDMSIYFSRFQIQNTTQNQYCRLIRNFKDHILGGDILLSTLNYECLIEDALAKYQIGTAYNDNPLKGAARVLKVHGSCNFIPENFLAPRSAGSTISASQKATINTSIKIVPAKEVAQELDKTGIGSAMSMYTEHKESPICALQLKQLRSEFIKYCRAAKVIITIGVKPNPEDAHIWGTIADSGATIYVCADEGTSNDWIEKWGNGKAYWIGEKFAESWHAIRKKIEEGLA